MLFSGEGFFDALERPGPNPVANAEARTGKSHGIACGLSRAGPSMLPFTVKTAPPKGSKPDAQSQRYYPMAALP